MNQWEGKLVWGLETESDTCVSEPSFCHSESLLPAPSYILATENGQETSSFARR